MRNIPFFENEVFSFYTFWTSGITTVDSAMHTASPSYPRKLHKVLKSVRATASSTDNLYFRRTTYYKLKLYGRKWLGKKLYRIN